MSRRDALHYLIHRDTRWSRSQEHAEGINLSLEDGRVLYAGRTNHLRQRLQYHTRSNYNQATFAFLLAREETGRMKATYRKVGSRRYLLNDPAFRVAFDKARERIRKMDVQFIKENDATRQALLEICVALWSDAKYNNFDNH